MKVKIVLSGGGTGGHIFPLVTVAKKIKEIAAQLDGKESEFLFIGPDGVFETQIMDENNIKRKKIFCGKLRRYFSFHYFIDIFKIPLGFCQAFWYLLWFMPDVVFAKGGFASVPVVVAAKLLFIPVLIHESDSVPGLANKFLGSLADRVAINFKRAEIYFPPHKTFIAGVPVKDSAIGGSKENARLFLKMKKEVKPVVLFLGGSQGAKIINEKVTSNIDALVKKYQIVHQTGISGYEDAVMEAERRGHKIGHSDYFPLSFVGEELKDIYALADVVVSRAGATNIAEIAANGKPLILIPIENSANDHQRINAFEVAREKAAFVLEEENFSINTLLHTLDRILKDESVKKKLSENIRKFYYPEAGEKISREVLNLALN
jgi:UDP-N-acetylglucosamine--N-acetylmuramyl-(pentapeptide) pyrophosphoryl-undecaprenol N-acetylglucosamine transferase